MNWAPLSNNEAKANQFIQTNLHKQTKQKKRVQSKADYHLQSAADNQAKGEEKHPSYQGKGRKVILYL